MRKKSATNLVILFAVVLGLVVSACTSAQTAVPAAIPIGAVVPLTGKYASGGAQVKAGYEIGVDDINKDGGVFIKQFNKKIPLKLIMVDDESDPSKTVSRLEQLYSSDKVMVYLGGFGSDLHAAGAAIADKNKVPYLGVAFALLGIHQKGYKYLFSPFVKSDGMAKGTFDMLNSIPKEQRPNKVAIFQEETDWGIELADLWRKEAAAGGYNIVVDEKYAPGTKDYSPMITKAKSAGAEVVLALPNPPDGMAMMKQMKELSFNAKAYILVRAPDGGTWGSDLGSTGEYVIGPGYVFSDILKYPGAKELGEKFKAKYGKPADAMVGPAYATIQILADALGRVDKYDRDAIRDALATSKMNTVQGQVAMRPNGTADVEFNAYQWLDGKQVLVWPPSQAAKPLVFPAPAWDKR